MKKMDQSMWRSRTKSISRSLGAVRGVQWTFSIHSAFLLKSQSENKKLSWSVWMSNKNVDIPCFKMIVSMSDRIWYKLWLPFLFCNDCFHIITHEYERHTKLSLYNVRIWNLHTTFDCSRKNWPCRTESIEIGFPEFQHSNCYSIESFYH